MNIPHRESELKSALLTTEKIVLPTFIAFGIEDSRRGGLPDQAHTGYGSTTWLEVKHATPSFELKTLQQKTLMALDAYGFCARYLVYFENRHVKLTFIIHPRHIQNPITPSVHFEAVTTGHDHKWVCEWLRNKHRRVR